MAKRNLIKTTKKMPRKSKLQQQILDTKAMGEEPKVNKNTTEIEFISAFNWYNYMTSKKDVVQWLVDYSGKAKLLQINLNKVNKTLCYVARMINNEHEVPARYKEALDNHIKELMKIKIEKPVVAAKEEKGPLHKEDKGDITISDFEEAYDQLDESFSAYEYLTTNDVPKIYCQKIVDYYSRVKEEIFLAWKKKDKEVTEAYSCFKARALKAMHDFLEKIIEDVNRYADNKAAMRKPRRKKAKSADAILKFFKCAKEDVNFKIMSIDPNRILKATELYVFNAKYSVLTKFVAKHGNTLSVNRTSIINFDPNESKSKRIGRKSQQAIEAVLNGNKKMRDNVFDIVNSDFIKIPERINENVVLLYAK